MSKRVKWSKDKKVYKKQKQIVSKFEVLQPRQYLLGSQSSKMSLGKPLCILFIKKKKIRWHG